MDEEIEEEIGYEDSTPSVLEQAKTEGWEAAYYNFGKAEGGRDWFNPSIVRREDGIWLIVRGSEPHPQGFPFGQNSIWAFEMDETGKVPKRGIRLRWKADDPEQHFEDPRGFYHPGIDQVIIGACTFIWYQDRTWTGPHQCIGSFDEAWECTKMDYPTLGGSPGRMERIVDKKKYEKNWLPFLHDSRLHILYKANPWNIVGYGQTWSDKKGYMGEGVSWAYGDVRGGTSPVKIGNQYFTFPHSSLMWRGRYRRYYAGAISFDAEPPFTPRMITPEPILRGSQNDPWAQKKPLVVFPCGALYRKGKWLVTCGINDMKAAWVEIPHEDLLKRMVPIGQSTETVFPSHGLSDAEIRLTKLRANAAKARAAKAAKRLATNGAQGEPVTGDVDSPLATRDQPLKRRKRRRRRTKQQMAEARAQALKEYEEKKPRTTEERRKSALLGVQRSEEDRLALLKAIGVPDESK